MRSTTKYKKKQRQKVKETFEAASTHTFQIRKNQAKSYMLYFRQMIKKNILQE